MRKYPEAACVVVLDGAFRVLAVTRKDDETQWGLPGGKREEGETLEQCAIRECREETGYLLKDLQKIHTSIVPGYRFYETTAFLARLDGPPVRARVGEGRSGFVDWHHLFAGPFSEYNFKVSLTLLDLLHDAAAKRNEHR